jgi:hypothetical protein
VAPDEATALQVWRIMNGYKALDEARDYPDGIDVELIDPKGTLKWDNEEGQGLQDVPVATLIAERNGEPGCIGSNNRA